MNMKKIVIILSLIFGMVIMIHAQQDNIRVIVFGAHPDDCDGDAGGTAILWSKMGCAVKFVSVTNGDAGHQEMGGSALAKRRMAEAMEAGRRFGVEYEVLDNHDGELTPDLKIRKEIIRLIREWKADVVITPRPNDYHPDHRYTAMLVQDAAYMVIVPNIVPETPPLKVNPVFLYTQDNFQKPNPFHPDIAVAIDDVFDKKIYALSAHESQFFEWLPWTMGMLDKVPEDDKARLEFIAQRYRGGVPDDVRQSLIKWYGEKNGSKVKYAEAFEICEFGSHPDEKEILRLFPMLGKN
jgi:LmbE family N-acetylglucosaminyl deacetylase